MTERYIWPNMKKDCQKWARACLSCQRSKIHKHTLSLRVKPAFLIEDETDDHPNFRQKTTPPKSEVREKTSAQTSVSKAKQLFARQKADDMSDSQHT
ncbi:hypothetical protein AVEN_116601-1 [Araneus ventricosus]|uniref:Integrase zinc-binding domain-containing protein n=1 Tax=Araneus ventricosus TaxID=182803 RepID=A0A4Y2DGG8_ARAVE|nr:hypothetical protein AVEN_116601-1 [Araneus ventricosus]